MNDNVVSFLNYKFGLSPNDKVALVTNVENGRAVSLKLNPDCQEEIGVIAHNDYLQGAILEIGDWVRFEDTRCGAVVIDRLARPGEKPLPRIEYCNGVVKIDENDPALQLYARP